MLSGTNSFSVYKPSNMLIWMLMAFQAGALNVGGLLACHSFVSHITGYASLAAFQFENTFDPAVALAFLAVPLFFLLGTIGSGYLVDRPIQLGQPARHHVLFAALTGLIGFVVVLGAGDQFGDFGVSVVDSREYRLVALLCFICGLQNGAVTSVSRSVIRTTHLTGITTDLGIGIVRVFARSLSPERLADEARANRMRLSIIFSFTLGSFVASYFLVQYQYLGFILPMATSSILFLYSMYSYYWPRFRHGS